ncbi:sensor histidine kinase [Feifania hominis]|uniref:histidine kinase n=1 Tax=Feifania hominis TaxID=2763660 RepID=A0A926HUD7_9FIRM|nr:sensor histidine kinase KdpD [Feifania hominis]MBC8535446.1 sensor histidine kinase KdpD [Feifania hominis]
MDEKRPSPGSLLRQIHRGNDAEKRGRLKIFFGYAAGVGKTFAMLEAARAAKAAGIDVVAGYIEPHTRPETLALLEGLEQLPPQEIHYRGLDLREFDLDAALARHPSLILVDELAHTNAETCRHTKRYQDIEELLRAGIDVFTTVNVQHIESLNDIIASITGITVRERIPDSVFDSADQVELVDIEPDDLIKRLSEGKIYRPTQARQALGHFFTRGNLAALREIALRRTADRLTRTKQHGEGEAGFADEHIMICLSSSPSNAKVIRTAARLADAFHGSFTALFVETPGTHELSSANRENLRRNLKLAEQLGARIATVYGDDVPSQISEYTRASGVSKIVIGRSNNRRSLLAPKNNFIDRLTALNPNIDIYIIPDTQPPFHGKLQKPLGHLKLSAGDLLKTLALLAGCSLIGLWFYQLGIRDANIIITYLLGVLFTAIVTQGRFYSVLFSLVSVSVFNYFFTAPRFSFEAYDASYLVTFLIMFVAALTVSSLTTRVKRQARQAALKAHRTEVLLETSQMLQRAGSRDEIFMRCARQVQKLLDRSILLYPVVQGALASALSFPLEKEQTLQAYLGQDERAVAQWVLQNNKHAGATTGTLPGAKCLYLAVRGHDRVFAVIGIVMDEGRDIDTFERSLLLAMLAECGLALEKEQERETKNEIALQAQREQLRANLLRAISHDLRTPLTSISGNAGVLMQNSQVLDETHRQRLYADIYDDAMWLINLVENLLAVTRMEDGSISLQLKPELLDEVIQEALRHIDRRAHEHHISVRLSDDLLMAKIDARLIVQVIINIVNNAVKYTPPESHIELSARREGSEVVVEIADDGPGVPDSDKSKLFDMFYTAENPQADGRRGLGLGLSLCRSIVQAHGGDIIVRDNSPHGAVFSFTLQAEEVICNE